jgi:hypothetical protein
MGKQRHHGQSMALWRIADDLTPQYRSGGAEQGARCPKHAPRVAARHKYPYCNRRSFQRFLCSPWTVLCMGAGTIGCPFRCGLFRDSGSSVEARVGRGDDLRKRSAISLRTWSTPRCSVAAIRSLCRGGKQPTDLARPVDMPRHDTDLAASRVDDTRAVRSH